MDDNESKFHLKIIQKKYSEILGVFLLLKL